MSFFVILPTAVPPAGSICAIDLVPAATSIVNGNKGVSGDTKHIGFAGFEVDRSQHYSICSECILFLAPSCVLVKAQEENIDDFFRKGLSDIEDFLFVCCSGFRETNFTAEKSLIIADSKIPISASGKDKGYKH